jgi:hypothetical protein
VGFIVGLAVGEKFGEDVAIPIGCWVRVSVVGDRDGGEVSNLISPSSQPKIAIIQCQSSS